MAIIPKRTIEDIRFQNDVVEVVGSYVTLKRAGSTFKACCPFHKEKTPSFVVNSGRQVFHCFGCGEGGDVFKFVMKYEAVDFVTAAKILADRVGIELEYEQGTGGGPDKSVLYKLLEGAAAFYQRVLMTSPAGETARQYLASRRLPGETCKEFMVGYAPEGWDTILTWAAKHDHSKANMEATGMIIKSTKSGSSRYYDRFRGRIMFPIRDAQGRVIGFSGRLMSGDTEAAKYVNSPETLLFRKSNVLYGLYKARRDIVDKREAIICEGQIDVIRCHQQGFTTAVAAQGTAFTEDHARIVGRSADAVVIAFDSDHAGRVASVKTARIFMTAGLAVRVAWLPTGEDPDSLLKEGGSEAFQKVIDDASSIIAFQIRAMGADEDKQSEVGVMRISKAVLETIAQSPNAVQRSRELQEASDILGVPVNALEDDLKRMLSRAAGRPGSRRTAAKTTHRGPVKRLSEEVRLTEHIVAMPALGELVEGYLPSDMLLDGQCAAIVACAMEAHADGVGLMSVIREHDDEEGTLGRFATELQMAPSRVVGVDSSREKAVKDLILYIWRRKLQKERAGLESQINAGGNKQLAERLRQMPFDLKGLTHWDSGSAIIEIEMAE
jgi:DNA primase